VKRKEAVKNIMSKITDELVITTTGLISREVHHMKDRPENFYMCGSMGCALSIGMGLALNTNRKVVVIDGDGAALMSLSSLVLSNFIKLKNLRHIILDNGTYGSTGSQMTCSGSVDFTALSKTEIIKIEPRDDSKPSRIEMEPEKILRRFMSAVKKKENK